MVSETRGMAFLNRMFLKAPKNTKNLQKKQDPYHTELESVRQDERGGGTVTTEFNATDDASATDSIDSSVPDTPMFNSNPGLSKYRRTYRRITHYDCMTGQTIGAEATALANYYQCLKEVDDNMEFANVGAGTGEGFENTMELKPMKYKT
jgi:hypothetical protein